MDRETITTYGFLTIATILMALLLALSTPVGNKIMTFAEEQINKITDSSGVMDVQADDSDYGTLVVSYKYEGSSNVIKTYKATLRYGETCVVPTYTQEGYVAKYQKDASYLEVPSTIVIDKKLMEMTIVLQPETYSITYSLNGGKWSSGTIYKTEYTYGTVYKLPDTVEKSGYMFVGWFEDSGLGGKRLYEIKEGVSGNKTLYAKYSKV